MNGITAGARMILRGTGKGGGASASAAGHEGAKVTFKGAKRLVAIQRLRFALFAIYVIPLLVITYLYITYIYPMFDSSGQDLMGLGISAVLTFAVILSMLGLALISRTANDSVETMRGINERMDRLLDTTSRFEEMGHVDTLVDSVARSAKELLNAEASSLLLYDREGGLRFEYVEGPASRHLKGRVLKAGEGITGWAARQDRPVLVNDVQDDDRFSKEFDQENGFTTRSIVCAPLTFSSRKLGLLEVINKRWGDGFTDQDLQLLVALAGHAAASIYRNVTADEMKGDFVQALDIIMTAIDNHLPEKKGHARRVARHAVKLAKKMGLSEDEVRRVYFGAMLHDIGFLKFSAAEENEKEKFRLHPALGSEMVRKVAQWADVAPLIRDHHERYDGKGYPSGLSGNDISLGGRIIAVAETLDVMTHRSYRSTVSFEEAMEEIMSNAGRQFDPQVARVFMETFRKEDVEEA
jgi:putative nucleotidyltransferase with HDIG domain